MASKLPSMGVAADNAFSMSLLTTAFEFAQKSDPGRTFVHPKVLTPGFAKSADGAAISHAAQDPTSSSATLLAARQYYALARKNSFLETSNSSVYRKRACFDKFLDCQRHNRTTARRLNHYFRHPSRMPTAVAEVLGSAQLDIFRLLGVEPTMGDWKKFLRAKIFSNGTIQGLASNGRGPKDTSAYAKLSPATTISTTRECLQAYARLLCNGVYGSHIYSGHQSGRIVKTSVGTTVPKDAVVDRFIAVEPLLNAMAQQGLLSMLKPYLRLWGVSLENQGRNKSLAQHASIIGCNPSGWSTIDLSSASDTITDPLVRYLLPARWYEHLNNARTAGVSIEGEEVQGYASFCTMGNAFTFPLQCLIFAALTRACIRASSCSSREYRVYGDDIIIPSSASLLLLEVLRFVGFIPNVHKSFITGFFRESCGGDYLHGENVAPVVLSENIGLTSVRHVFFNRLQRVTPTHPCLWIIYESFIDPLIGPAVDKEGVSSAFLECPEHILHDRKLGWYDKRCQTVKYRVLGLVPVMRKVWQENEAVAYLSALAGSSTGAAVSITPTVVKAEKTKKQVREKRCHDLRGSQRYHVRSVRVDGTYRLPAYSPIWYIL